MRNEKGGGRWVMKGLKAEEEREKSQEEEEGKRKEGRRRKREKGDSRVHN